jgi:hypothetical protein
MSQQQSADWVRLAQSPSQTERIEAFFGGHGYEPHRHDTYAIGQTIAGVQSFHYRGGLQHSLPGGRWCFTRTKYTMARRAPRRGFTTAWSISNRR